MIAWLLFFFVFFLNGAQSHARTRAAFQILLSLFVAVILDNLELDEDLKKLKQVGGRRAVDSVF